MLWGGLCSPCMDRGQDLAAKFPERTGDDPAGEAVSGEPGHPGVGGGSQYRFETFERGDRLSQKVARRQGWQSATYSGVAVFHQNDGLVGHLEYFDDDDALNHGVRPGEITNVEVDPDHQRKGLATAMFDLARDAEDRLHHSEDLSDDARAWIAGMNQRASAEEGN